MKKILSFLLDWWWLFVLGAVTLLACVALYVFTAHWTNERVTYCAAREMVYYRDACWDPGILQRLP
jgi:hypothetical protein